MTLTANDSVRTGANNSDALMRVNGADIAVRCLRDQSIAHYFLPNFPTHYKHLNITASSIEWVAASTHPAIDHCSDDWVLLQSGDLFPRLNRLKER